MSEKIPNREAIEKKFSRFHNTSKLILAVVFIGSVVSIYSVLEQIFFSSFHRIPIWFLIFPLLIMGRSLFPLLSFLRCDSQEVHRAKSESFGKIEKDEFLKVVDECLTPLRNRRLEVPAVYLLDSGEINAFAINSLFFNLIRPINGIYLCQALFQVMRIDEIRSILAHELAHFKRYTPLFMRISFIRSLFLGFFPMMLVHRWGLPYDNWAGVVAFFFCCIVGYTVLSMIFNLMTNLNDRMMEYLSDYEAASQHGKLPMINALLVLGRMSEIHEEVFRIVLRKVENDPHLSLEPINEIVELVLGNIPRNLFLTKSQIEKMVAGTFQQDTIAELKSKQALSTEKQSEKKELINDLKKKFSSKPPLHDWKKIDFNVRDYRIDEIEYPGFIKILKKQNKKQLFNLLSENFMAQSADSHPTIRRRILFLHENLS